VHTTAHAHLLFFSNQGRIFRLRAHEVPMKERTARGTAMINLLPLRKEETIQSIIATKDFDNNNFLLFATKQGQVKKTPMREYDKARKEGFVAINLRKKDELVHVVETTGKDDIFIVSRHGQAIRFDENEVRSMGRGAGGVRGMALRESDEVVSCDVAQKGQDILVVTGGGFGKRTKMDQFRRIGRGNQGVRAIKLTANKGFVAAAFMVRPDDEVFVVSSGGVTARIRAKDISSQGRDATGVRVVKLASGQQVAAAAPVFASRNGEEGGSGE
jgi:DNA gyrase subunit A